MTSILAVSCGVGLILVGLAPVAQHWIDAGKIGALSLVLLLCSFGIAVQDVTIDALAEEIMEEEDKKFGSLM